MEGDLNRKLRQIFNLGGGEGHAQRIESGLTASGIPDWNYCVRGAEGWIESKHISEWPKRGSTVVRFKRYTAHQKLWLWKRHRAGGRAFLMVQIANEYLLFDATAAQTVGEVSRKGLYLLAEAVWKKSINKKEFLQIICE